MAANPYDSAPIPLRARRKPPGEYHFNLGDQEAYDATKDGQVRHIRFPASTGNGLLAAMWAVPTASSILFVLLVRCWKRREGATWTEWVRVPHRELAAVAGVNKSTVAPAVAHLVRLKVIESRKAITGAVGERTAHAEYRVHHSLFPANGQLYFMLPTILAYSGMWSLIPRASARHLLLTIAARAAIKCETVIREGNESQGQDEEQIERRLARIRSETPLSISTLAEASGMRASVVHDALRILLSPTIADGEGFISAGVGRTGRYFYPNPSALSVRYTDPAMLNDPTERARQVAQMWPWIQPRAKAKKRRPARWGRKAA